jgi:hypothetical protein
MTAGELREALSEIPADRTVLISHDGLRNIYEVRDAGNAVLIR